MRNYRALSLLIFSGIIVFTLISCERDEYIIATPIKIGNDCDTTNVSFSKTVLPFIQQCKPCHNNSDHYGGINLEGYDNIKSVAKNGQLVGSLRSSMSGYFSGSDCDYVKIQAWINQGSKNN